MIRELLCQLVSFYVLLIIIRVISSWFPANPNGPFGQIIRLVFRATDPVLLPVRRTLTHRDVSIGRAAAKVSGA